MGQFDSSGMEVMAGAGGMMGQLAVGIAGGVPGTSSPGFESSAMSKLGKSAGVKPTIDSLPDKVGPT